MKNTDYIIPTALIPATGWYAQFRTIDEDDPTQKLIGYEPVVCWGLTQAGTIIGFLVDCCGSAELHPCSLEDDFAIYVYSPDMPPEDRVIKCAPQKKQVPLS